MNFQKHLEETIVSGDMAALGARTGVLDRDSIARLIAKYKFEKDPEKIKLDPLFKQWEKSVQDDILAELEGTRRSK